MFIKYVNETEKEINIRGLKIAPGASKESQVLLKHFDEAVGNGELSIFINDGYREIKVKPVGLADKPETEQVQMPPPDISNGSDKTVEIVVPPADPNQNQNTAPDSVVEDENKEGETEVNSDNADTSEPANPADETIQDENTGAGEDNAESAESETGGDTAPDPAE